MKFSRYHAVETSGLELIGKVIDQWDEWGYKPILMSQIMRTKMRAHPDPEQIVVTTLVFERREEEEAL